MPRFGRRHAVLSIVFLVGIGLGRLVLPRLEPRSEVTAILRARNGECGFATATIDYLFAQPRLLTDGGEGLQCGERWQLSDNGYLFCECL